jgi:splicing factor, arginine/serine-rich 4/5/6
MSRRLYLGRLSQDCREEDITKLLDGVGKVTDCRIIAGKGQHYQLHVALGT